MDYGVHSVRVQLHDLVHRRFLLSLGVSLPLRTLTPVSYRLSRRCRFLLVDFELFSLFFLQFYQCNWRTLGACQLSEAQIKNVVRRIASYRIARRWLNNSVTSRTRQICRSLVGLSVSQPTRASPPSSGHGKRSHISN